MNEGGGEDVKVEEGVRAVGEMENQSWTLDGERRRSHRGGGGITRWTITMGWGGGGTTGTQDIYIYIYMYICVYISAGPSKRVPPGCGGAVHQTVQQLPS